MLVELKEDLNLKTAHTKPGEVYEVLSVKEITVNGRVKPVKWYKLKYSEGITITANEMQVKKVTNGENNS